MTSFEAGLRGGAMALFVLLAVIGLRDGRQVPAVRYSALLSLCAIAYLIEAAPEFARNRPDWVIPLRVLSITTPAVFYLWALAHFDDDFEASWNHWLPWLGMLMLGGWAATTNQWLAWRSAQIAALVLVGLGVWQTLAGRSGDLVEGRRRLRLALAIGAAAFMVSLNLLAFVVDDNVNLVAGAVAPAAVTALVLGTALLRLQLCPGVQPAAPETAAATPVRAGPMPRAATLADPDEAALLARLRNLMEVDRVYREEGLSIAAVAERLGLPEYRLRRLINQRLGHRNFTSYVNGYRLAETTAALADPAQAGVPILTIALDAGFQSIGPFNRAFKAHTGLTPTEYRRTHMGTPQAKAAE